MSRIGREPIKILDDVKVSVVERQVTVSGLKGTLNIVVPKELEVTISDNEVIVKNNETTRESRALWGTYRSLICNMIEGVLKGYKKSLELVGVGYRVSKVGNDLSILVGFSHPIVVKAEAGITFDVPSDTKIIVNGVDKCLVGQVAANIRKIRKPEPYKGKGIRYEGEVVKRKAGKAGKVGA